jgi:hypothetical protein
MWGRRMRTIVRLVVCVCVVAITAACDPVLERRYMNEGAGVDLYQTDRVAQADLLQQYITFICAQAGSDCGSNWATFVQAGMNDIDQRCDGFLAWLDAKRRDREPALAEIAAIGGAAHNIMTVTGSDPTALNVLSTAFALASATYANWNSRLLIAANQSTVQEVVYNSQGDFRKKILTYPIPDQPTAIYLLRNYLRLCMPSTIEARINVSTTLVERGLPSSAQGNTVVKSLTRTSPAVAARGPVVRLDTGGVVNDDASAALNKFLRPDGPQGAVDQTHLAQVRDFIAKKNFNPVPQVPTFVRATDFAAARQELARQLGLIP